MKMRHIHNTVFGLLALLFGVGTGVAQPSAGHSVLSQHTWYRLAVAGEGIYQLDYATLSAMDIDMEHLNPNQIRIFGNVSGRLPEKNSETRPDDLNELVIHVSDGGDGTFDADDYVLFYGQESTRWRLLEGSPKVYERERNYYSDSTYYYLCVDSGEDGLRIGTKATLPVEGATTVVTEFPDFSWHEEELFSPYSIGQNWFGEMLNSQDTALQLSFCLPDLVKTKPVYIKTTLMGRIRNANMHYDLWVNDNVLSQMGTIDETSNDYRYGKTATVDRQILSETDTLQFSLHLYPDANGPMLFLDYVEMFYWRQLKRHGAAFPFRLIPAQLGDGISAVWVQNVSHECQLWDVTEPLSPAVQEGVLSANNFVFATNERAEHRYFMFKPAGVRPIGSWSRVPNQDLHALSGNADMLIITAPLFWEQACELAQFHEQEDGLTSLVVNVKEIHNEFSTGTSDPSGIRDFVRMVYQRSNGRLKYLTLFGRASFDFRDLKGFDRNFVPCFETMDHPEYMLSFCTDDFFGMMDDGEGRNSTGRVDLGIGRLPVSTVKEAEAVLRKIRLYHDLPATFGEWKTNHLLLAGNDIYHNQTYIIPSEEGGRIIDTILHGMNVMKVYADAYPTVNTTSGQQIPQAHDELLRVFDKGFLAMTYCGHGGVKGLTNVGLFSVADFPNLRNHGKLPLVFTATCEFSKYDDPLLISAGEQLFLQEEGGAGALLTSCRPTQSPTNRIFLKAFSNNLYRRDDEGKPLRFGDLTRMTKCDPSNYSNTAVDAQNKNIMYLLIGDPALRLALPEEEIATVRINGKDPDLSEIAIGAMSMVSVEGEVRRGGQTDTDFNGQLWLRLFDKKSKIVPLDAPTVNYHHFKDVLYQGCVSVRNGRFTASFQVPVDIKQGTGICRLSYYAYDSIRGIDAQGAYDNLALGGTDPSMMPDNEGPQISFYWNTPSFQNGDLVERQGNLIADLYDAQGIYHYDFSIGRDITLNSSLPAYDNLILNERYEPVLDDYRRGRIVIPVEDLDEGTYEFDLKVWDLHNNSSTAQLWFVVGEDLFLAGVRNYPNPFSEETYITMTHVGDDGEFHVNLEVFDLLGRCVTTISKNLTSTGGNLEPLRWDGRDRYGQLLRTGLYLYRLTLTDEHGASRSVCQRMLISR